MTIKINKTGETYSIQCLDGITISGTDIELLKKRAGYMYRIFDNSIRWEIVDLDLDHEQTKLEQYKNAQIVNL